MKLWEFWETKADPSFLAHFWEMGSSQNREYLLGFDGIQKWERDREKVLGSLSNRLKTFRSDKDSRGKYEFKV